MPRYFFNIDDGYSEPDDTGTEFPDIYIAQSEAIRMSGEVIRELSARLWGGPDWRLEVTDEYGTSLFVLCFSAEEHILPKASATTL